MMVMVLINETEAELVHKFRCDARRLQSVCQLAFTFDNSQLRLIHRRCGPGTHRNETAPPTLGTIMVRISGRGGSVPDPIDASMQRGKIAGSTLHGGSGAALQTRRASARRGA
ncbi:MAG: hypothetical protein WA825_08740 [Steroidobacteraceae bacterium]